MAEYDPSEFLALCASILDDGEVSSDEAYRLAEWLNDHPDAARNWPGSELVKPLQEIWTDGSVNRRELHRLARILISIQREWARRPKTAISSISGNPPPEFSEADLHTVRLPSFDAKFRVPSQSEPGRFYEVDLRGPSCTCPDWIMGRSRLPRGHLTRCCKHVLHVYATLPRKGKSDGWITAFIENGWPAHPGAEWHLMTLGADQVLFCTASDKGWANVFAKDGRQYHRFGFNVEEERWAYGTEPIGADAIARAIVACGRGESDRPSFVEHAAQKIDVGASRFNPAFRIWIMAAFIVAIVVGAILTWKTLRTEPQLDRAVSPSVQQTASAMSNASLMPPQTSTASPIASASTQSEQNRQRSKAAVGATPAEQWTTRLVRPVHVNVSGRNVVLASGTRLRVLARSNKDVMVWYDYAAVTIPLSSTDLK